MPNASPPEIVVLAGVNGAGKSSLLGALLGHRGIQYFNPDEATRRIRETHGLSLDEANIRAWEEGRRLLEESIETRSPHAFETTLGGNTIPALLKTASEAGFDVLIWFVGLSSPEQHIARVAARVAAGGHDIPEEKIRERWNRSRRNIIDLMSSIAELRVFDNSLEGDPLAGARPKLRQVLHWTRSEGILAPEIDALASTPEWAKPIVAQALKLRRR